MRLRCIVAAAFLTLVAAGARADDWIDNLDESLRVSFFKGAVTAQLSGLLDLEGYYTEQPTTGLLTNRGSFLFNPRLTLNLDVQITPAVYIFVEGRVDRGFDPADNDLQGRLDQYAIRYHPFGEIPVWVQAGKFASVVGTYGERYDSWDNPFINAPLPYENLTAAFDDSVPLSPAQLLYWRYAADDVYERLPIMWGPSYASGFELYGQAGPVEMAAEVKNAALSSRPDYWDIGSGGLDHPTWSGHIDWRPSPTWRFGLSGSIGPFLRPGASAYGLPPGESAYPPGRGLDDYNQTTLAQDITFAWRHWQVWAECFESRFDEPRAGNCDTLAYYIEAKYKFAPQLFGALRWNQQLFNSIRIDEYDFEPWGSDIWRIDAALTYRWTEDLQTKLQYSFTGQNLPQRGQENLVAGQITVRF